MKLAPTRRWHLRSGSRFEAMGKAAVTLMVSQI